MFLIPRVRFSDLERANLEHEVRPVLFRECLFPKERAVGAHTAKQACEAWKIERNGKARCV